MGLVIIPANHLCKTLGVKNQVTNMLQDLESKAQMFFFSPFLPAKFTFHKNIFISQTHLLAYQHPSIFPKDYRKDKYMSFNLKQRPMLNLVLKHQSKKALLGLKKTSQSSPNCAGILSFNSCHLGPPQISQASSKKAKKNRD